jgi:hypothetical protein
MLPRCAKPVAPVRVGNAHHDEAAPRPTRVTLNVLVRTRARGNARCFLRVERRAPPLGARRSTTCPHRLAVELALECLLDRARTPLTGFLPLPPYLPHKQYGICSGFARAAPRERKRGQQTSDFRAAFRAHSDNATFGNLQALRETGATGLEPALYLRDPHPNRAVKALTASGDVRDRCWARLPVWLRPSC